VTRLLLLGNPEPSSWKWDVAAAAARLGWQVTHLPARNIPTAEVVGHARGADLMIWARTHRHNPDGDVAAMLRRVEESGTVTVGLHLDLYWGVPHREPAIGVDPWWTCQYVFTADGGDRDWAGRGVNHRWCPPAVGRRWLLPCQPKNLLKHEAVFVGTYSRRAHGVDRWHLLQWARRRFGLGFAHYGGSAATRVTGHDLCAVYRAAGVVLGDSAPAHRYWSDRVPHTLARGGVLTHPHTAGFAEAGFDATSMLLYDRGDLDSLSRLVGQLTPDRRRDLVDAGRQVVADRHLWEHRLTQIGEQVLK